MRKKIFTCLLALCVSMGLSPVSVIAASLPEIKPDMGLVVFYRNSSFKGGAVHLNIRSSDGSAGILKSGTMFYKYFEPGSRTFDVSTPSVAGSDLLTLDIEAGNTYFVRGEVLIGWPVGRPALRQESESRALNDLDKL